MGTVITEWTPREACRLQKALRLTNEAYAERLGCAPRTVAKWHANPGMRLTLDLQQALDTMLALSAQDDRTRFDELAQHVESDRSQLRRWSRRLDSDPSLSGALERLDTLQDATPGSARSRLVAQLESHGPGDVHRKLRARGTAGRGEIARALQEFYGPFPDGYGFVALDCPLGIESTSLVSATRWLARRDDLREGDELFHLAYDAKAPALGTDDRLHEAALARLAEIVVTRTKFVDAPIFRLLEAPSTSTHPMRFALDTFSRYALSWDLLESEVCEIVTGHRFEHDLRQRLLPDADALLSPGRRVCAGGCQALCAFARPGGRGQSADYVLLIQERSSRVVNASGLLATIPKCFHQPMTDAGREVSVGASLKRELEEELFGRAELDGDCTSPALASPMHPSRMSDPMRWLEDANSWDMAVTGFSLNSVTGNYEVPALIAVHDEDFWSRYGGAIEANWEASRLRTYSSRDIDGLAALVHDPGWSNEGLVAFALGLKRLAELNPERVAPLPFEIGVAS